jgi:hypothetical protein
MSKSQDREAITHQNPRSTVKVLRYALVIVYLGFLIVYHKWGVYDSEAWSKAYYIWDMAVDVLWITVVCTATKEMFYRFCPMIIYAVIRLMVEIATIYEPIARANDPLVVDILLYLCGLACVLLILKHRITEYYDKKVS